jgi:quercetin dioxygenase-like cupin family protein
MKRAIGLAAWSLTVCLCAPCAARAEHGEGHVLVTPDSLKWMASPALPPGAQIAVVTGDPTKAGELYVLRATLPDGYKVPPHWHPTDENVTVIQGKMLFGAGNAFDSSLLKEAPAGSFARMPKGMRHFAMAKGQTIIQVHGVGPFEFNYVNPADDPRNKK